MSYKKVTNSCKQLRTSYENVTKSYKRGIGIDLEILFCEILENGLPVSPPKQPKIKFHFPASGRCRSSEKPLHRTKCTFCKGLTFPPEKLTKHIVWPKHVYLARLEKPRPFPPPRHRPRKSAQVTTSMEDLAF